MCGIFLEGLVSKRQVIQDWMYDDSVSPLGISYQNLAFNLFSKIPRAHSHVQSFSQDSCKFRRNDS